MAIAGVVFLALAGVGGFLSATGANILAWSSFSTRTLGKQWTKLQSTGFVVACIVLNASGILLFAMSTALGGAVATVMPIQTGANLLGNMFWQTTLGMKYYNKSMRVGTLVLVFAVAELGEIGPNEPDLPVLELMSDPVAIAWMAFMGISTLVAIYATYKTYGRPIDSTSKLCSFVSVVTLTTVIGASVGKCFLKVKGAAFALVVCLYFLDGIFCMAFTVLANAQCDVAIFIPAQLSSQLVLNMLTGYLVWGDGAYVEHTTSYLLVYALCICGVYLNSDMDIVGDWTRSYSIRSSMLSEGRAYSRFGHAVLSLLGAWQRGPTTDNNQAELSSVLNIGLETGALKPHELVSLSLLSLRQKGSKPSPEMVHWVEHRVKLFKEYCQWDAAFLQAFRRTLSESDLALLRELEQEAEARSELSTLSYASTTSVLLDVAHSNISMGQRDVLLEHRER